MNLDTALQKCGLSFKEARVYQAVLEVGPACTLAIARRANLKRTTTYEILKRIESKRIISSQVRNNRQYFFIANPEKLKNIIEEQRHIIQDITPYILELFTQKSKQVKVQMFEGEEGIKDIFLDTLKCKKKEIIQYTSVKLFLQYPGEIFMKKYVQKRASLKIYNYALLPLNDPVPKNTIFSRTSKKYLREVRYTDLFFTNFICIYDEKVAMVSTKRENFGFIIESEEFSKTLQDWFWTIWKHSRKSKK